MDPHIAFTVGGIVLLLLMSAFFSGSETALTAASEARLSQLARRGNKAAVTVLELKRRSDRLIGSILIGNNIVNIFASALATGALITVFGENRSEEHTSELQSLMRISYAVFCLKKKKTK